MRSLRDPPGYVVVIAEWEVANAKCIFLLSFTWLVTLIKQKNSSRNELSETA